MKKIAFYISDCEWKSVIRSGIIIDTLLRLEEEMELYIKSGEKGISYLKGWLKEDSRLHYDVADVDAGLVTDLENGAINWAATEEMATAFVDRWEDLVEKESAFLVEADVGLVVSDFCPWIFLAADDLRVKSLLITDVTWDYIYNEHLEEELCDSYRECYELASRVFLYDLHPGEMESFCNDYEVFSMISRAHDMEWIEKTQAEGEHPLVYKNLQGDCLVENSQNLIAASDYIITHGNWNTLSEALLTNKKIALLPREDHAAECNAADILEEREQGIRICEADLSDMDSLLGRLHAFTYSYEHDYHNSDYVLAKMILTVYPKKRRRKRA